MARIKNVSVGMLLSALAASNALAQPVTLSVSSGTAAITSQTNSGGAWTVLILVSAGSPAVFTVTTSTANVVVEKIEVECDADCLMTVNQSGGGTFSEIRNIVEKSTSSPESFEIQSVVLNGVLGPGNVAAEVIQQVTVGGDLTATVTAGPRASSADSDITTIDVGGDLRGNVYALHGFIQTIDVGGDIRGVDALTLLDIHARDGLVFVSAEEIQFASIFANLASTPTTGTISRLETRSGGVSDVEINAHSIAPSSIVGTEGVFIEGDFGAVDAYTGMGFLQTLTHPIEIQGSLLGSINIVDGGTGFGSGTQGDITIHGDVFEPGYLDFHYEPFNSGKVRTLIRVGGSFGSPSDVTPFLDASSLFEGSLVGQVIVNAYAASGSMNGDFYVDDDLLSPVPYYLETGLVGGVGLVPFALHAEDSTPPDEGFTAPGATWVWVRLYGPVTWDENESMPFLIEYSTDNGTTWTNDSANWFVHSGKGTRTIQLGYQDGITDPAPIPAERDYRIRPIRTGDAALLCDKLLTNDPVLVNDFTYYFYTP